MFGAMYFMYYINRLISTKVDSTWREPVTWRSLVQRLTVCAVHVDKV